MRRVPAAILALLVLPAAAHAQGSPEDDGTPVVGGGSFNTAPLLKPGRYADTVAAGETVYWKVALGKGQILSAKAIVDTSEIETDFQASDYQEGLDNLDYRMDLFTPLREQLSSENDAIYDKASTELSGDDDAGAKTGEVTAPRALGFEQILQGDYNVAKFPAPGEWYISLSVADSDSYPAEVPAELPVDLEVKVEGTAEPSSPDFAAELATPTPAPTEDAEPSPQETELLSGSADAGDPTLTIALVGALALLGGLGLGALAARVLPRQ